MRSGCNQLLLAAALWGWLLSPTSAAGLDIAPFYTTNQSPLVQIFGLPSAERALILPRGTVAGTVALDVASNFVDDQDRGEAILLDGESWRTTLTVRFGLADGMEGGLDLPFTGHGGGVLDSFIVGWHDFFGLPQGRRDREPRNRLNYTYTRDGSTLLHRDDSSFGPGDLRLSAGVQLYRSEGESPAGVALRGSLKLPTGESNRLQGSGSTDFALWLTASDDYRLSLGHAALFAAAGGMVMSRGDILPAQQRRFAGFGTLGCGWSPADWIAFKVQTSGHTPFYDRSDLAPLNTPAVQLIIGGTLGVAAGTTLDIGVSEDLVVGASPDVAFHLALRRQF
jgi:uncharacterized protein DUF3187